MTKNLIATLLFTVMLQVLSAQNTFDINFPGADRDQLCQRFTQVFRQLPKEVNFSIQRDKTNTLYFEINDKQWFDHLFRNPGDGIALDVVTKDRYGCLEVLLDVGQIRGELLKPVYAASLKKTLKPHGNLFRARLGKLSQEYVNKEVEFNILFLSDKNLCRYQTIFKLEAYQLDLLDMGMYLDSLTYRTRLSAKTDEDQYTLKYKTLSFTIPFERNKATYSKEDIRPVYDSLRLTDFNIKKIKIKAYSSIEGDLQRNLELQKQRASSIVNSLQSFQKPTIITEVSSAQNWVEFLNDITGTNYESFKTLSKEEINKRVTGAVAEDLEKYLKNHRKAIISLELEKKDKYNEQSVEKLITLFNEAIDEDKLPKAHDLQQSIFERLKRREADPEILNKMTMPRQLKYVPFFNENSAMRFLLDKRNMLIAYNEFKSLEKLAPDNYRIKYNIAALELILWRYNVQPFDANVLKNGITALERYGVSGELIKRMLVNYHIVNSQKMMRKRDFVNKDKSVEYIYANYKDLALTDYDYLSLAQFLSYYSNLENAVKLLQDQVKRIDINENLLFYYLNLTLVNEELTQDADYRTIMLNAINMDKPRFCRLFNAFGDGGVTFQLLEDDYLMDTYCENCTN